MPQLLHRVGRKALSLTGLSVQRAVDPFAGLVAAGLAPRTILDVGAALGDWSRAAAKAFPGARVVLVEPLAEFAPVLHSLAGTLGRSRRRRGRRRRPRRASAPSTCTRIWSGARCCTSPRARTWTVSPATCGSSLSTAGRRARARAAVPAQARRPGSRARRTRGRGRRRRRLARDPRRGLVLPLLRRRSDLRGASLRRSASMGFVVYDVRQPVAAAARRRARAGRPPLRPGGQPGAPGALVRVPGPARRDRTSEFAAAIRRRIERGE